MQITDLLKECLETGASDLHLSSGARPILRISGEMETLTSFDVLTDESISSMLLEIMTEEQKQEYIETLECDFSITSEETNSRFRINAFFQSRGYAAVFRIIPNDILSLEQLKAPDVFKEVAKKPNGLILVTGPTGSGKSTTLAAIIDYINSNFKGHVLTVEDPIEFVHQNKNCLINQREVKRDTLSFNNALKSALREDPDYILVGELRDLETIRLALTAAETGHLVFGTLHTSSAAKTIDRIINVFPDGEQEMIRGMLSGSLVSVIAQILLKKKGGGRVAAHEILLGSPAVKNLIRENKLPQINTVMQTNKNIGMQSLDMDLDSLYQRGLITIEDVKKYSKNIK